MKLHFVQNLITKFVISRISLCSSILVHKLQRGDTCHLELNWTNQLPLYLPHLKFSCVLNSIIEPFVHLFPLIWNLGLSVGLISHRQQCLCLQKPQRPRFDLIWLCSKDCAWVWVWRCITRPGKVGSESWGLWFTCCCHYVSTGLLKKWLSLLLLMWFLMLFALPTPLVLKPFT